MPHSGNITLHLSHINEGENWWGKLLAIREAEGKCAISSHWLCEPISLHLVQDLLLGLGLRGSPGKGNVSFKGRLQDFNLLRPQKEIASQVNLSKTFSRFFGSFKIYLLDQVGVGTAACNELLQVLNVLLLLLVLLHLHDLILRHSLDIRVVVTYVGKCGRKTRRE